jgi:WD40 repeat protein
MFDVFFGQQFDAHSDYIRSLAVHPTLPYLLSGSDDMSIKLWDWDKGWQCTATYEGHAHYVMMVQWNPKDSHVFASASMDRSIKVRYICAFGVFSFIFSIGLGHNGWFNFCALHFERPHEGRELLGLLPHG